MNQLNLSGLVEQLVLVLHFLNKNGDLKERFVGFNKLQRIDANTISSTLIEKMCKLGLDLDLNKMLAKCFDGAPVMSGEYNGVQKN